MNNIIMSVKMGLEVREFIEKAHGKRLRCYGICKKTYAIDYLMGYPHDGGLEDVTGKKWWVFFKCPTCNYGTSFTHLPRRIEETEKIERDAWNLR